MLANAINLLTQGMTFMGGALIVFGLINLGMTIKDGMQGGGGQLFPQHQGGLPCGLVRAEPDGVVGDLSAAHGKLRRAQVPA